MSEWIACSERMPPKPGYYLVWDTTCKGGDTFVMRFVGNGGYEASTGERVRDGITHWMPLPKPPGGQS